VASSVLVELLLLLLFWTVAHPTPTHAHSLDGLSHNVLLVHSSPTVE
jgi:hypothetical protein